MTRRIDLSGISWVKLSFVDVFGAGHSMQMPAERLSTALERGEPFDGSSLEGRARLLETDMRLLPDVNTLVRVGDKLARAVCTVLTEDGTPWGGDPRTALQAVVEATGDLGRNYTAGAELEFYLLDASGEPIDGGGYFDDTESDGLSIVRTAADRLVSYGIGIASSHHEAGPGQYEIDLASVPALSLADGLVLAKHVIREIAGEAGCQATFMPRPLAAQAGSGLHLHQQVGAQFVGGGGELSEIGRFFLAGQLAHAAGLSALTAPTVNSYKRLHSGPEAPSAVVWAHLNRGALVRVGPSKTIEFRGADPSANPYLLLAGLIAAAADGLENSLELPAPCEEELGGFDPAAGESMRFMPLPRDLDDALDALLADDMLMDTFDRQLLSRLIDGRRAEAASYRTHVTSWEISHYLDLA